MSGAEVAALVGVAASAAGTGLSMAGAAESRDRMNRTIEQQLAAQQQFQRQASPVFQQSLQESTPQRVQSQIDLGSQSASEMYNRLRSLPTGTSSLPTDDRTQSQTQQKIQQQQGAQAGLQGYQASSLAQWLKDLETRNQLGIISNLSQGQANITGPLLNYAQQAGAGLAGVGSLLGTGGSLLGMWGALKSGQQQQGSPGHPPTDNSPPPYIYPAG